MWESIQSFSGHLGPFLINIWLGYWAYVQIEQHAYAKVAGFVVFLLFNECDRIRRAIDFQTRLTGLHRTGTSVSPGIS